MLKFLKTNKRIRKNYTFDPKIVKKLRELVSYYGVTETNLIENTIYTKWKEVYNNEND